MSDACRNHPLESDSSYFVGLLSRNQRRIYAYIMSLVGNFNDADDIMQETSRIMWEKFDQFQKGTNFFAWAKRIVFLHVLEIRKKKASHRELSVFDDAVFDSIQQCDPQSDLTDYFLDALRKCVRKLKPEDQNVLQLKYQYNSTVKEISNQYNRTTQSLYRTLGRIHGLLVKCVKRTMASERNPV